MQGSNEGRLPLKVVLCRGLSSTKDILPLKVPSIEGYLPLKVFFHQRSSFIRGCLPTKVVIHRRLSSTYYNNLIDLIFVRTVNIPNLNFLPCLEVAYIFFWQNVRSKHTKEYIEAACFLKIYGFWANVKVSFWHKLSHSTILQGHFFHIVFVNAKFVLVTQNVLPKISGIMG